eukprot:gene15617-4697_t
MFLNLRIFTCKYSNETQMRLAAAIPERLRLQIRPYCTGKRLADLVAKSGRRLVPNTPVTSDIDDMLYTVPDHRTGTRVQNAKNIVRKGRDGLHGIEMIELPSGGRSAVGYAYLLWSTQGFDVHGPKFDRRNVNAILIDCGNTNFSK